MSSYYYSMFEKIAALMEQARVSSSDCVILVTAQLEGAELISCVRMGPVPQKIAVEAVPAAAPKKPAKKSKKPRKTRATPGWSLTPAEIFQAQQLIANGTSLSKAAGILGRSSSGLRYALDREAKKNAAGARKLG